MTERLLEAVLDKKDIKIGTGNHNLISYWDDGQHYTTINIYELMHLMKEWAWEKGIWIKSNVNGSIGYAEYGNNNDGERIGIFTSNRGEPEAVEKACEWILDEIQN